MKQIIFKDIDDKLHMLFKSWCILKGTSMKKAFIKFMESKVKTK